MTRAKQGKIITFYSYKGGTGRSMAVANIAWILASNSKSVLVLDWDLEAPGLQRYFRPFLVDRELTSSPGIVDLISDFTLEAITPLEKGEKLAPDWFLPKTDIDPYVISLNWKFPTGGQLDFIPAGRQGPDYGQRFAAINWQKFYDVLGGGAFIEQLKINMRSQYDYILVDSRTGVSDTSGICTIQMPDTLVVCFTFNNQSIEGAASVTQGVVEQRAVQDSRSSLTSANAKEQSSAAIADQFYQNPYRFKIFPVPMRVDQSEKDKLGIRRSYAKLRFDPFLDGKTVVDRRAFWGAVAVPYVPYFSYEEILAAFKDDPSDPNTCLAAFTRIAAEITERDVTAYVPLIEPKDRDAVLQDFASVPMPELMQGTGGGAGPSEDGKASSGKGTGAANTVIVGGTGSAESVETELESSLRRAEATYRSLSDEERERARLLWMRLVRIPRPGEKIENSKVRVPVRDIGAESTSVIEKFQMADVVSVARDNETGEPTVEVKNEELLRSWPTLDRWIRDDRDLMIWRQDLQSSMAQWEERRRNWDYLLAGRRLWKANQWYTTHRKYLSNNEAAYIKASRRWFVRVNVVAITLVLVILASFFFYQTSTDKTRKAEIIATDAESQIASAKRGPQLSADQYQLGLLLAFEAQQLAPTAKAEGLLKTELARLPRKLSSIDIKNTVLSVAVSADGSQVLSVTGTPKAPGPSALQEDRTAQLNNLPNGDFIVRVPFRQRSSTFVLSPDARYLAITSPSTQGSPYPAEVLEAATGKTVVAISHGDQVSDMTFSPDGAYFATASRDKSVRVVNLRDVRNGGSPFKIAYSAVVTAVSFSGNSRHLAVTTADSVVHVLRNIPSATQFSDSRQLKVGSLELGLFALSYDGRHLASVTFEDNTVSLWDVESEKMIKQYPNDAAFLYSLSFTPDSKLLLAAETGNVHVWSLQGEDNDNRIQHDANEVVFSDDGRYFGAFLDKTARVWEYDGSSFKEIASLMNRSNLLRLRFAGSNFVVTAGADNLITLWKLGEPVTDNLRHEACSRLTRNMTIDEWNDHVASYLGPYRKTCSDLP